TPRLPHAHLRPTRWRAPRQANNDTVRVQSIQQAVTEDDLEYTDLRHISEAMIDTGADVSVISQRLVETHNIPFNVTKGTLLLAGDNNKVNRIGTTHPLLIHYNYKTIYHAFEIMNLPDQIDLYLGMDLIPTLGIYIGGLAVQWSDQITSVKEKAVDDHPPEPNDSPAGTQEEQKTFHTTLQSYVKANQSIPTTSFCPLDISIVTLPTTNTPSDKVNYRQYPIPHKLFPVVDQAVQTWLADGTIVRAPVNTSWNSPITLAPKKDEFGQATGKRPCLDPRHINKFIPDDNYPLPLIRDIFQKLAGSTVFTTLDLKSAFHRFLIHPDDQHKTTFTHNGRQYMFQGCPFGLKPLSAKFQRVMHFIFDDMPYGHTFVDDVIIHSANMTDHMKHVTKAIQKLTAANLILNPKKCHFAQKSVYLLGFCITAKGTYLDKRKLSNIQAWPTPQTGHDIQKFLGIVNYFREHIPNLDLPT
ncbi:hypothetical protein, partial, partial [Absidia glauca]